MKDTTQPAGQVWDAGSYATNGRFVATLASPVVELLAPQPGEHILDLGCGDGALTEQLAAAGAIVTGVDVSSSMVDAAQARSLKSARGFRIDHADATALTYEDEFDAVFSNAALHWIRDASQVLENIRRSLHPGGRFVAEMGGQGNIAAIRTALRAVLGEHGIDAEEAAASFYPSPSHYRRLLEAAGFRVNSIQLIPRPTPLPSGMESWLNTFRNGVLDRLPPAGRAAAVERAVALLKPVLCDFDGNWTADYVRLRFHANRIN